MIADLKLAKRYLGAKFGYAEPLEDGVYAIPANTSKGKAFMRLEIANSAPKGSDNFRLYWDEALTISWYDADKPQNLSESAFSKAFRLLEDANHE